MHLARQVGDEAPTTSRGKGSAPTRIDNVSGARSLLYDEIPGDEDSAPAWEHLTLAVTFPGSNEVQPVAAQPRSAKFNYFVGDDDSKWASNVPSFGEVVYRNLYDGVDLHITGDGARGFASESDADGVLKYEFHVAPGADWSQIRIQYDGIESLCIDQAGSLHIATSLGTLTDAAPLVWQENGATVVPAVEREAIGNTSSNGRDARSTDLTIPARFELVNNTTYTITLDGPVDSNRGLVVDPNLHWMAYLGGSSDEHVYGCAVDSSGNALVTGESFSVDFGGRINDLHGANDAILAKISSAGQLVWMTYLGGTATEFGYAVEVDASDNAFVGGSTGSPDFSGRTNHYHGTGDCFIAKIDSAGSVRWATFVGGSRHEGDSDIGGIAVDLALDVEGHVLMTGTTDSDDFEGRNNALHGRRDAFVVKVGHLGELYWMTYLGGGDWDPGRGIAAGSDGSAFVTGNTGSGDFEGRTNRRHGDYDTFAAKVSPLGSVEWMVYLGGSNDEFGRDVAVSSNGDVFITGETRSQDFEGAVGEWPGGHSVAFVSKVKPSGAHVWTMFLGSGYGRNVALGPDSTIIVAGSTTSDSFPGRINERHGGSDAFVLQLDQPSSIRWMMYLGGSDTDMAYGVAVDRDENVLVSGDTVSVDFEGRNNSYYGSGGYAGDGFIARVRLLDAVVDLLVNATCPTGGPIHIEWTGATPNESAALIYARDTGSFVVPNGNPCAGTTLGLGTNQIQLVTVVNSDANGSRTLNATIGPNLCGSYLQLLDLTTCTTSNVARIE
ncbi:MAG: SBBP repeat-containing protein [Phycisphaerales bacterium]|nr:SBBP repeat-containing protein [Phycisphaerales bacterium]